MKLIDYECIRAGGGGSSARLVAFGEFAGKAGMIGGLRGLGLRLLSLGHSTPLLSVAPAHAYADYAEACRGLAAVGSRITAEGLPTCHSPLVIGIAGTGNVARGAAHALNALGAEAVRWVSADELAPLVAQAQACAHASSSEYRRCIYACVLEPHHLVQPRAPDGEAAQGEVAHGDAAHGDAAHGDAAHGEAERRFDKAAYYARPESFESIFFHRYAPHLSMLVTAMYWDRRYPRLLSRAQLGALGRGRAPGGAPDGASGGAPDGGSDGGCDGASGGLHESSSLAGGRHLLAVADLTCDVRGAVEGLVRTSSLDAPYYVYSPDTDAEAASLDEPGVLMLGVDILPAELPREASQHFGDALMPYAPLLATPAHSRPAPLPPELAHATIADQGVLAQPCTPLDRHTRRGVLRKRPKTFGSARRGGRLGHTAPPDTRPLQAHAPF